MKKIDPKSIDERKWQDRWEEAGIFHVDGGVSEGQSVSEGVSETPEDRSLKNGKGKYYILDMFPYPSAQGLHVGHPEGYTASDIIARKRRMEGYRVLHPMGWDAFGLPAENYAIKVGGHPKDITAENIGNFRRQIKSLGFSYDWTREVNTSSEDYYRWTQWLFLKLYEMGLAYRKTAPVNWCESCKTVLANEQVESGRCERCKNGVIQKELKQWFFRITDYADRLIDGLGGIDWPENIKTMQKNWIGRSEGAEIIFKIKGVDESVSVFTTRPDTLFGVTALVLAPEHPLVDILTDPARKSEIDSYRKEANGKSELDRSSMEEKTGVFTGGFVAHPLTGEDIPVWIGDYVLMNYGTGAVMSVPAHDERDFAFAERYGLDVKWVVLPAEGEWARDEAFTELGVLTGSGGFDGLSSDEAKRKITETLSSSGTGKSRVNYHLRDWLVSRQRYWGAPIPIILCLRCGEVPVPEKDLPVTLPDDVDFRPTGESPLISSKTFHHVMCPKCGSDSARREVDTMDTFVDSSWYFLRYCDPKNSEMFASPASLENWCPVDMYVGGAEHAVLHLLYARFITKVLKDANLIAFEEPFLALRNQGLIMGTDGEKMSKSRGNVVNPDDVINEWGADVFRLYEMFMGDFEKSKPWKTESIVGQSRFLEKVATLVNDSVTIWDRYPSATPGLKITHSLHQTIRKVSDDIEAFKFNTAISAMMIFTNEALRKRDVRDIPCGFLVREDLESFIKLLTPFAPHFCEEVWHEALGHTTFVSVERWPAYRDEFVATKDVEIVVQVNGKIKGRFSIGGGASEDELREKALAVDDVQIAIQGRGVMRVIVVPDRLVNIVVE